MIYTVTTDATEEQVIERMLAIDNATRAANELPAITPAEYVQRTLSVSLNHFQRQLADQDAVSINDAFLKADPATRDQIKSLLDANVVELRA